MNSFLRIDIVPKLSGLKPHYFSKDMITAIIEKCKPKEEWRWIVLANRHYPSVTLRDQLNKWD